MRSLSDQTVTELGGPLSVLTRQERDHARLDRLLDELAATRGAEQERALHRIARLPVLRADEDPSTRRDPAGSSGKGAA